MNVLGISCFYHDSAAAISIDGRLVAAAQEERFSRVKHDAELPVRAVGYCLERAGLTLDRVDRLAFYEKPLPKFDRILVGYMASPFRSYRAFLKALPVWLKRKLWIEHTLRKELDYRGEICYVPHHLSHAAGAFYCSPFEDAATLTIDGVGEWATASYGVAENNSVRLLKEMVYPHSVGLFYSAFTHYLGFRVNSAEYKIMGLAPYGTPRFADLIKQELVTIHPDGSVHLHLRNFEFHRSLQMTGRAFERLFGRPRRDPESAVDDFHADIAASVQQVTEKIVLAMAAHAREVTGRTRLCFSGGVALNCSANSLLLRSGMFDDLYIQPASGDAGGAVGSALYVHYTETGNAKRSQPFFSLGPTFSDDDIRHCLEEASIPYQQLSPEQRAVQIAEALDAGAIVALHQGPMEFGPRALGFRSILADPRQPDMKAKINAAVKYREPFRPFAPAVLEERVTEFFETGRPSPYMLINFTVRQEKRAVIPAVTHEDGSARIQTVTQDDNRVLHDILRAFEQRTKVPVLLNTSFNLRGHPIVNRPEEALATFCSGGIDLLVMGSYLIRKKDVPAGVIDRLRVDQRPD